MMVFRTTEQGCKWTRLYVSNTLRQNIKIFFKIFKIHFEVIYNKWYSFKICIFLKFYFQLKDNDNIVLVSAIHQHESVIGIRMLPLSWTTPSHPSRLSQSMHFSSLSQTANSHWLSILHMVIYMFPYYSLHLSHPLPPPPSVSKVCSRVCISIAACK